MIRNLLKWTAAGLVLLCGTALCLATPDSAGNRSAAPPTTQLAQAIATELVSAGSIVVLEPPRIDDYWVSATLQPGGPVVFDGYAPDEATRKALGQGQGADVTWLKLGRGAPERYRPAVDFGLAALAYMSEGRFALRGDVITITGIARSAADYEALVGTLSQPAPPGLVLAPPDIAAPPAASYVWSATKDASGAITLGGMVPNPDAAALLLAASGASTSETITYASGEPRDFLASAQTGLALLQWLGEGRVSLDGSAWLVTGTAKTPADKDAIDADFMTRQLASAGWSMAVAAPAPAAAAPTPTEPTVAAQQPTEPPAAPSIDPAYAFSATRAANGTIILSGQLPSDAAQRYFAAITDGDMAAVTLADGAPETFLTSAETGLRALLTLSQGQLDFADGRWSLHGLAADAPTRDAIATALAADDATTWTSAIDIPPPPAEPIAAPTATPSTTVDIAACQQPLADFSARNAILFQSGAAVIAAASAPALDELATSLGLCPDAVVHVEGHTDADGDEQLNLALSVARAEAVVQALIERGVPAARLYAMGYGESAPIADNDTGAGKQLNRRIVVTVTDEHY